MEEEKVGEKERESEKEEKDKIRERIEFLRREIQYHDWRYYVLKSPVISDAEYDKLFEELKKLEEMYPEFITPDSPTQRVGEKIEGGFQTYPHSIPMLSLDNAFSEDELKEFDDRVKRFLGTTRDIEYSVEPKVDGISIEVIYEHGILKRALTRGDGFYGEDITPQVKTIKVIPLRLLNDFPDLVEVRGEVYMRREDFEILNSEMIKRGEKPFANPRNAAAGSLKQIDPAKVAERKLSAVFYGNGIISGVRTQAELLEKLKSWGFPVVPEWRICMGIKEVLDYAKELMKRRFDFEFDGIVVKVNDFDLRRELGEKARSPRWAIAFKLPSNEVTTRILFITHHVGRTGVLTPVAILEPVRIGGVVVSRATLHNPDEIRRLGVKIGDYVFVRRAGEVIPEVVAVIEERRQGFEIDYELPKTCPSCGSTVVKEEDEVFPRCINMSCPEQLQERIKHFVSRDAFNIEGFGERLISELISRGIVKDISDIFFIRKIDLLKFWGIGERLATKLIENIERAKKISLKRFIYALGIRHVGEATAKILADRFKTIDAFLSKFEILQLLEVPGIGPKIAESISNFLKNEKNMNSIKRMLEAGVQILPEEEIVKRSDKLKGLVFVFTGELSQPREVVKKMVLEMGGRVSETVTKTTNYLVVGKNPGSKLEKAKSLGIKIITEEEFRKMLEDS